MKNFINVAPGEFLYRGKVESFNYDSKTKKLAMELKAGTESFNYQEIVEPREFLTILDSCHEDYMPINGDDELYIHVKEVEFRSFEVVELITEFGLSVDYWPWADAFNPMNKVTN